MGYKRRFGGLLLLGLLLILSGCQGAPPTAMLVQSAQTPAPEEAADASGVTRSDEHTVALYYRLQGEDMLARETRTIALPNDYRLESRLIELLIEGPRASNLELTGLFPANTRLISVSEQDTMLFVTLSQEFLSTPHDMPVNWRDDRSLYEEVLARRRLAVDSIVNTLTECTEYTSVQLLIQPNVQEAYGQRIARKEIYASETDSTLLFGPVYRSESMILTHYNTANIILSWQQKNWERLYRFVANKQGRPTAEAFEQEMDERRISLFSYSISPGHVSSDGQKAIFSVQLGLSGADGVHQIITSVPLAFTLEQDIWKISYETLVRLMQAAR
ncbi:MAG TPA: GerMN domain-containing protein [Clostridia bacterium]|nr:GerMN domain-containing protein [Clostridia bacterium]